tara:strand:+ start:2426 stop:2695 length:270 start_codon:yes stop_codon:yes gene_type:complete
MYQPYPYRHNNFQSQPSFGKLDLTNTEKYVFASRAVGISVALYQANKANPIKTGSDLVEALFIATLMGGIFPLPYLGFVVLDSVSDKKK